MKSKNKTILCIISMVAAILLSSCATARHRDLTLKNTLSIFLLNNEKGSFFCIPVQYMGDYQIEKFEFTDGYILIGDYEILLKREELNISVYLNEKSDMDGSSDSEFDLVHLEEHGRISLSKMDVPLATKHESGDTANHYYIFLEKYLNDDEGKKIADEFERGNAYSKLYIGFNITIDGEIQAGNGMYDDFELYDGPALDSAWFPPNLNFFKARYLAK